MDLRVYPGLQCLESSWKRSDPCSGSDSQDKWNQDVLVSEWLRKGEGKEKFRIQSRSRHVLIINDVTADRSGEMNSEVNGSILLFRQSPETLTWSFKVQNSSKHTQKPTQDLLRAIENKNWEIFLKASPLIKQSLFQSLKTEKDPQTSWMSGKAPENGGTLPEPAVTPKNSSRKVHISVKRIKWKLKTHWSHLGCFISVHCGGA